MSESEQTDKIICEEHENMKSIDKSLHLYYFYTVSMVFIIQILSLKRNNITEFAEYLPVVLLLLILTYTFMDCTIGRRIVKYTVHSLLYGEELNDSWKYSAVSFIVSAICFLALLPFKIGVDKGWIELSFSGMNILSVLAMYFLVYVLFLASYLVIIQGTIELVKLLIKPKFVKKMKILTNKQISRIRGKVKIFNEVVKITNNLFIKIAKFPYLNFIYRLFMITLSVGISTLIYKAWIYYHTRIW